VQADRPTRYSPESSLEVELVFNAERLHFVDAESAETLRVVNSSLILSLFLQSLNDGKKNVSRAVKSWLMYGISGRAPVRD